MVDVALWWFILGLPQGQLDEDNKHRSNCQLEAIHIQSSNKTVTEKIRFLQWNQIEHTIPVLHKGKTNWAHFHHCF